MDNTIHLVPRMVYERVFVRSAYAHRKAIKLAYDLKIVKKALRKAEAEIERLKGELECLKK